MNSVISNLLR